MPEVNGNCAGFPEKPSIYLQFKNQDCWANNGGMRTLSQRKYGGKQIINLDYGCSGLGTALHEMGHSLGMHHEQQRPDRDQSVRILLDNVAPAKRSNFDTYDDAWTSLPYDYASIMQYEDDLFSRNGRKTIVPRNCEPNCPTKLANHDGFTLMDQKQLAIMLKCDKSQVKHWTEKLECVDWKEKSGKALDCKKYVKDGKCRVDAAPCCDCGARWSGFPSRVYTVDNKADADCEDARPAEVCKMAAEKGLCWSGFVRGICERSCEVCVGEQNDPRRLNSYADDKSSMDDSVRDLVWSGGKYYTGETANGLPNGKGVYSWGNGAKYVGTFANGKVVDGAMRFHGQDTYVGSYAGWMFKEGKEYLKAGLYTAGTYEGFQHKDGPCSLKWSNGATFVGTCANGRRSFGEMKWVNKNSGVYWESWKGGFNAADMPSGKGDLHWTNGQYYHGELSDN